MDASKLERIKKRVIDFSKYRAAANQTVTLLVDRVNELIEVVQHQQKEIEELKGGGNEAGQAG